MTDLQMYAIVADDARKRLYSYLDALTIPEHEYDMIWASIRTLTKYEGLWHREQIRKKIKKLFKEDWEEQFLHDLIIVNPRTGEVTRNADGKVIRTLTGEELQQVVPRQYLPASE